MNSNVSYIDDVKVHGYNAYFDDWLKANGYGTQVELKESNKNGDEDHLKVLFNLFELFIDWCESKDLIINHCFKEVFYE